MPTNALTATNLASGADGVGGPPLYVNPFVVIDPQTLLPQVYTNPVTAQPGTTLQIYGYVECTVNETVFVNYNVREIFNRNGINLNASASFSLVANTPLLVNLAIALPSNMPPSAYRVDVLIYSSDFLTTLTYLNTATTFYVQPGSSVLPFKLGVYRAAQDPIAISMYENWLGRRMDYILDTVPSGDLGDASLAISFAKMVGSGWSFFASQWVGNESRMILTIPMLPTQGNYGSPSLGATTAGNALASGASGSYDSYWVTMGTNLVNSGYANNYIRLGWEMNGNWFNWSAVFNPSAWITYFQRIVGILRATSGANFKFVFNPTLGQQSYPPDQIYPGNAYVDAIGLDVYDQDFNGHYPILVTDSPAQALVKQQAVWANDIVKTFNPYDLLYWVNFAATNSKPFGIYEWGVMAINNANGGGDDTYFIQQMHDYAAANGISPLIYFDLLGDQALFSSPITPTQFPNASALYQQLFGPTAGVMANNISTGAAGIDAIVLGQKDILIATSISGTSDHLDTTLMLSAKFSLITGSLASATASLGVPSFNPPVVISDYALDNGMTTFDVNCDRIYVCTGPITDFNSVISTALGYKNFGAGNAFGGINNGSPSGRVVTSVAFTDGFINNGGLAICWAAVDFANSHLLAWGVLSGDVSVSSGQLFGLPSFAIHEPGWFAGAFITINFNPAISLTTLADGFDRPSIYSPLLTAPSLTARSISLDRPNMIAGYSLTAFNFVPIRVNAFGVPVLNTNSVFTSTSLATHASGLGTPVLTSGTPPAIVITRNVFQQPFGINSIWNTPLGVGTGGLISGGTGPHGGATFRYANSDGPVYEFAGHTIANTLCDENLILYGPASPSRPLYASGVEWSGGQSARCSATQTPVGISLPVPTNASYTNVIGSLPNCSAAIIESNRRTIYQTQPLQICVVGGTTNGSFTTGNGFPTFITAINTVDIFSDETNLFTGTKPSAIGAHGGSFMSALGGTIRYNDIIPGNCPLVPGVADVMRHALAIGTWHIYNNFTSGFVWPAIHTDTGSDGLLLALLPTFNINSLSTAPARSIAWTAMNYGIYNNDDSAWDDINLETEYSYGDSSVNCPTGRTSSQFQSVWGYTMQPEPNTNEAFGNDIITICQNLYVITNNSPSSIGGPGASRTQPLHVAPTDPGVITSAPVVTNVGFSVSHTVAAVSVIGQVQAANWPYWWALSGTGAANFWIEPKTGVIHTAIANITAGTYTLTATATNIIGNGTGTVTITVT